MERITVLGRSSQDTQRIGGKACALNALARAGFKIPEGFIIPIHVIEEGLDSISDEIWAAWEALGSELVAVRSSATSEDGELASWAGQFSTFLNVQSREFMQRIKDCLLSLNSTKTQVYGRSHGMSTGKLAVVVQRMLKSDVSGVAFSAHPVSNNLNHAIIEAGFGLGEAIVSGIVTPDTYVIDKHSKSILSKYIANQTTALMSTNTWVAPPHGNMQKLSDDHIKQLTTIVCKLEAFWKRPVDVEWALVENELYITQCRPITTLNRNL
jgi:pyruvate,water dikinase